MSRHTIVPLVLVACTSAPTRVTIVVSADPAWQLDGYELRFDGRDKQTDAVGKLEVEVSDATAGHASDLQLWGLAAGDRIVYGTTSLTPALHGDVAVSLALAPLSCATACADGETACNGEATTTCALGSDGCPHWSDPVACLDPAPYCSNGACSATCTNECPAAGLNVCDGLGVRTCLPSPNDPCLHWTQPVPCIVPDHGIATCATTSCGLTCDSGYEPDGDTCTHTIRVVFVSSGAYSPNFGSLAAADAICQQLAGAAGLPGTFMAWLSSSTQATGDRMQHASKPYVRVDGTVIATSWADFTDGQLSAPIAVDEHDAPYNGYVWTNSGANGAVFYSSSAYTCFDWTYDAAGGYEALAGFAGGTDLTWAQYVALPCDQTARLYCVEQ
jgi:hypothetical protein